MQSHAHDAETTAPKTPTAADLAARVEALEATLARIAPLIGELPPPVPQPTTT